MVPLQLFPAKSRRSYLNHLLPRNRGGWSATGATAVSRPGRVRLRRRGVVSLAGARLATRVAATVAVAVHSLRFVEVIVRVVRRQVSCSSCGLDA